MESEPPLANPPAAPRKRHWSSFVSIQPPPPTVESIHPPKTWREYLLGREGASVSISIVVHLILCIILAIPLMHGMSSDDAIVTTIRESDADLDTLGDLIETPVFTAQKSMNSDDLTAPRIDEQAPYLPIPENAALADSASKPGEEDGDSSADLAGAVGGYLLKEPDNAVKAGRFTAFSRPVISRAIGNRPAVYGEPGDPPLARMPYFVVLQIRVDPKRKAYPISDLIGSVVGTDGYTQKIPERMFFLDDNGDPQPVRRNKPIKVIQGIVQLLLDVPGGDADVRDNIYLKSKMLREEQNLQLIFQSRSRAKPE